MKILFLCTGNSCRSQMAEGWAKYLKANQIDSYSAGIHSHGLDPNAVKVMLEAGVDISQHRSKNVSELLDIPFDYIITVCNNANEACPVFPKKTKVIHVVFDDPPKLTEQITDEEKKVNCYRRVRDEIRDYISQLPDILKN